MDNARCIVEKGTGDGVVESYHNAFSSVVNEIQNFLTDLVEERTSPHSSERLLAIQNKQSIIVSIEENLYNLVRTLDQSPCNPAARSLVQNLIEGLDTILLTAIDAMDNADDSTAELLKNITQDRGSTMERIRNTYLSGESALDMQSKATLLYVTNLFERTVWMLNRLSRLLEIRENN
jgi:DNA-binding ferritin-like protein